MSMDRSPAVPSPSWAPRCTARSRAAWTSGAAAAYVQLSALSLVARSAVLAAYSGSLASLDHQPQTR